MPVGKNQLTPRQRKFAAEYHVLSVSPDCDDPVAAINTFRKCFRSLGQKS